MIELAAVFCNVMFVLENIMKRPRSVIRKSCPNPACKHQGLTHMGNIVLNGFSRLKRSRRRRYRCKTCGRNFCTTTATPYYRIQKSPAVFDEVCVMSVEGISKSSIARIKGLAWNTISAWQEKAAKASFNYQDDMVRDFPVQELQADEIRTFIDRRKTPIYIITCIDVWSRLWISRLLGRRNIKHIRKLFNDVISRVDVMDTPLITSDGFSPYEVAIKGMFGVNCVYGQVVKTRRRNKIVSVDRKLIIGSRDDLEEALEQSEDSETLNTSFVERHNLSIRRGCSYLNRFTPAHARRRDRLDQQTELYRCYYNFIRPQMALKFGRLYKTPAMQEGLVDRPLTFRQIFMSESSFVAIFILSCLRPGTMVKLNAA